MQTSQRNLGGGHKVIIFLMVLVKIIRELGQLTRPIYRGGLDHERQVFFLITLADVQVKHPCDQRSLQTRTCLLQHIETRTGQLRAAFKIDDPKCSAKVPVGKRREIKLTRLTHSLDDNVLTIIFSIRCARIGNVRQCGHQIVQFRFDVRDLLVQLRDLIANHAHRFDLGLSLCGVFHFADLLRDGVPLRFQLLYLRKQAATLFIQPQNGIDGRRVVLPVSQGFANDLRVLTDQVHIEHIAPPRA